MTKEEKNMNGLRERTTVTLLIARAHALINARKSNAIVNGIVTKTNEGAAKGSWRYEFNSHRDNELDIRIVEHADKSTLNTHLETVGSRNGLWRADGSFFHVAEMKDTSLNEELWVYAFIWGDTKKFEAAILPDSLENEALFWSVLDLHHSEVLDIIKSVIAISGHVIYGETKHADF